MRRALALIVVVYFAIGGVIGGVMRQAIPAINTRGVLYIAATWPLQLRASPIKAPVPIWAFSFPKASNTEERRP